MSFDVRPRGPPSRGGERCPLSCRIISDRVLALADSLCDRGIDVILDRYVHPGPAEGWPRWMERNLDAAQFVLMVCTETYRRRVRSEEKPGQGTGLGYRPSVSLRSPNRCEPRSGSDAQ